MPIFTTTKHNLDMMTRYLLITLALILAVQLNAQHDHLAPCGSPAYKSEWLKKYQLHPDQYSTNRDELIYVPIAVHLVGEDDGRLMPNALLIQESLCNLNEDFAQADIQFYLGQPINYIFDSRYAIHETVLQGAQMMQEYDIDQMINCYFMEDAAGNCGYNLPYAGMCVSSNCAGPDDHTWAHEMGHQLALPHPFLGWEGGQGYEGTSQTSWTEPSPEKVLYNYTFFKDTLILDTLIIDTAYVELVDGSNCTFAADGFCDTKPDYLAYRWACNDDNLSPTTQLDPTGVEFVSDGSLIMSYALDNCSSRFTEEQIAAMRAKLVSDKADHLGSENPQAPVVFTTAGDIMPTDLQPVNPQNIELSWQAQEGATLYLVQLSILENFGIPVLNTIVSSPSVVIPNLQFPTRDHYFRVKAFNEYNFCADWLEGIGSFKPDELVSTEHIADVEWAVYPTVVNNGQSLYLQAPADLRLSVTLYNTAGALVSQWRETNTTTPLTIDGLPSGIYIVQLSNGQQSTTQKIAVQ